LPLSVRELQDIGAPADVIDRARSAAAQQHWVRIDQWRM
jgi:hypothetical protein